MTSLIPPRSPVGRFSHLQEYSWITLETPCWAAIAASVKTITEQSRELAQLQKAEISAWTPHAYRAAVASCMTGNEVTLVSSQFSIWDYFVVTVIHYIYIFSYRDPVSFVIWLSDQVAQRVPRSLISVSAPLMHTNRDIFRKHHTFPRKHHTGYSFIDTAYLKPKPCFKSSLRILFEEVESGEEKYE